MMEWVRRQRQTKTELGWMMCITSAARHHHSRRPRLIRDAIRQTELETNTIMPRRRRRRRRHHHHHHHHHIHYLRSTIPSYRPCRRMGQGWPSRGVRSQRK